jgi:ribosomal-protein-alanine N-acetyltransferase
MTRTWTTDRLLLSQLTPADAPLVVDYGRRSREFHQPFEPIRAADFWEPTVVAERLASELQDALEDRSLTLYLREYGGGATILGRVVLLRIARGALQSCQVGYGLAPDATGKGYMAEALTKVVDIAFAELGLHRIEINILPENKRSIAVARRCGFTYEGVTRHAYRIAGRWRDHERFSRLAEEVVA